MNVEEALFLDNNGNQVIDQMSSKSDKAAFGWAVIVWAASLAVAVNCESVFEVNTTALHGQAIQLVVTWDGVGSRGRYVDLTIRNAAENQTCADVSCQRLGIDAVSGRTRVAIGGRISFICIYPINSNAGARDANAARRDRLYSGLQGL